jgi:molybdopterin-guanine dinucleotide biosynthesis protein
MKIIAIAGATSKAGKTLLAEQMIRYCAERYSPVYAVKFTTTSDLPTPCPRGAPCTVCDLSEKFRIIRDPEILLMPGKNTQRLHAAGATEVIWVVAKKSQLATAYQHLLTHLPQDSVAIMEGSTVTSLSHPDVLFYVLANHIPPARWKDSAAEIISSSDFVILNRKAKFPDHPLLKLPASVLTLDLAHNEATAVREIRERLDSLLASLVLPS